MTTGQSPTQRPARRSARQLASTARSRHRSRILRAAAPLAVVLSLLIGTAIAYEIQQPDRTDPAYLSPISDAELGGRRLARLLEDRGVVVDRQTKTSEALVLAAKGDTTLLVPAPSLVHPYYLRMIKLLPASVQVVLVAPDQRVLSNARLPARVDGSRMASRSARPSCGFRPAVVAGVAGVFRTRYEVDKSDQIQRCYGGALTLLRRGAATVSLVGADDPFRNDRINEHNNATLASELLSATGRVVWLDLHRMESSPRYLDDPALASQEPAPPSLGPGSPDPDFTQPDRNGGHAGEGYGDDGENQGEDQEEYQEDGDDERTRASNPLWSAFPPWVFATVALLAFAALLYAIAAGRRLGGPVTEPLPVMVRATETVTGRGRLYQRARARGPAASTLRETAIDRLASSLGLAKTTEREELVDTVARHSNWSRESVTEALFGQEPVDDRELVQLALTIEALLAAVTHQAPPSTASGGTH